MIKIGISIKYQVSSIKYHAIRLKIWNKAKYWF